MIVHETYLRNGKCYITLYQNVSSPADLNIEKKKKNTLRLTEYENNTSPAGRSACDNAARSERDELEI